MADKADSDDDFVEVEHPAPPKTMVRTATNALKSAMTVAAVGAATTYVQTAGVTYALESIGVTAIASGCWTVASSVVPPVMNAVTAVTPTVLSAAGVVASAAVTTPGIVVCSAVGAKMVYNRATQTTLEG
eukprot:m.71753 g.71753  ORF g.71753 m.71753 type:complete len:130 (-) comp24387_c1_seq2:216-605(-)